MDSKLGSQEPLTEEAEPLRWFHYNLELLLEDVELGDRVELCFDSFDWTRVVLGMYAFYFNDGRMHAHKFNWKQFASSKGETVLVHCLATAGWLDNITLLPPHGAEFLG